LALNKLSAPRDILDTYKEITTEHLKMSKDIMEENRVGQQNDMMAWFWRLDNGVSNDDWMTECKFAFDSAQ